MFIVLTSSQREVNAKSLMRHLYHACTVNFIFITQHCNTPQGRQAAVQKLVLGCTAYIHSFSTLSRCAPHKWKIYQHQERPNAPGGFPLIAVQADACVSSAHCFTLYLPQYIVSSIYFAYTPRPRFLWHQGRWANNLLVYKLSAAAGAPTASLN
jgi:hypothetical protein